MNREMGIIIRLLPCQNRVYEEVHEKRRSLIKFDIYRGVSSGILKKIADNKFKKVKRYCVQWGGYSILKATFSILEEALNHCKYDRLILLTGLDYPIKSDVVIQSFFVMSLVQSEKVHVLGTPEELNVFMESHISEYNRKVWKKF